MREELLIALIGLFLKAIEIALSISKMLPSASEEDDGSVPFSMFIDKAKILTTNPEMLFAGRRVETMEQ